MTDAAADRRRRPSARTSHIGLLDELIGPELVPRDHAGRDHDPRAAARRRRRAGARRHDRDLAGGPGGPLRAARASRGFGRLRAPSRRALRVRHREAGRVPCADGGLQAPHLVGRRVRARPLEAARDPDLLPGRGGANAADPSSPARRRGARDPHRRRRTDGAYASTSACRAPGKQPSSRSDGVAATPTHPSRNRRRRSGRTDARASPGARGDRVGHARGAHPAALPGTHPRRRHRAMARDPRSSASENGWSGRGSSTTASSCGSTACPTASISPTLPAGRRSVYGQQELMNDLVAPARRRRRPPVRGRRDVAVHDLDGDKPRHVTARRARPRAPLRRRRRLRRLPRRLPDADPGGVRRTFETAYPFAWLGILAHGRAGHRGADLRSHDRGFALTRMRSPELSRLYLQCRPTSDRATGRTSGSGTSSTCGSRPTTARTRRTRARSIEKSVTAMRCFVSSRCSTAGCSWPATLRTSCPPTGAKGMNLAVHDVRVLAAALAALVRARTTPRRSIAIPTTACGASGGRRTSRCS